MKLAFLLIVPLLGFSQTGSFDDLKKLPKDKLEIAINDSIQKMHSLDFWNFLLYVKEEKLANLNDYNKQLIRKMEESEMPLEIHFLTKILIEQKTEKHIIENILDKKRKVWEMHPNWTPKFWKMISEYNLNISPSPIYPKGKVAEILAGYVKDNLLGENPMLNLNGDTLTEYPKDKLKEFLHEFNVVDMTYISKEKCAGLYGFRGKDGMLVVSTKL